MKAVAKVDAGICGFQTMIQANSTDNQHVTFTIQSDCEKIQTVAANLQGEEPIDAYSEIDSRTPSKIMETVSKTLIGCCSGCVVPVGFYKSMQIAAKLALPKDIEIKIEAFD
jgi:hypothetical protein